MADLTERDLTVIQETHDTVLEIKVVLLGKNGDEGLCGDVKYLQRDHSRLKQHFLILVGILGGSGIFGGGIYGLIKLFK